MEGKGKWEGNKEGKRKGKGREEEGKESIGEKEMLRKKEREGENEGNRNWEGKIEVISSGEENEVEIGGEGDNKASGIFVYP